MAVARYYVCFFDLPCQYRYRIVLMRVAELKLLPKFSLSKAGNNGMGLLVRISRVEKGLDVQIG